MKKILYKLFFQEIKESFTTQLKRKKQKIQSAQDELVGLACKHLQETENNNEMK